MSLWQMSVSGAVMIVVITVLRALLLERLPKRTFLVLWQIALARLLVPFSVPFGGSVYVLVQRGTQAVTGTNRPAAGPTLPGDFTAGMAAEAAAAPHPAAVQAVPGWAVIWLAGALVVGTTTAFATSAPASTEELDRQMNQKASHTVTEEETMMSYVNPDDGKTYYSFDDGKTFTPLTDAELEALYPTQDIEWWTYDEYKAWLDNEKIQLQSMLGERGSVNGGEEFVWTQEKIDETIALYEETLQDIKNGMMYSKTVDGQDDVRVVYDPADREMGTAAITK